MSIYPRKCRNCNHPITTGRSHKIFCSRSCKEKNRKPWSKHKKFFCEECGFIPIHACQLDVDHIDGNKKNNNTANLKTLCANCHRLKTHLNEEFKPIEKRREPL